MSTVALSRPATIGSAMITGTAAGDTSGTFRIMVQEFTDDFEVRMTEVTGDGSTAPTFQHGALIYGQFSMVGYMVATEAIGIANLSSNVNGGYGTTAPHTLEVKFDAGIKISGKVLVNRIRRSLSRKGPHIRLAITGMFTEEQPVESLVT
jgi:hypothetical protein